MRSQRIRTDATLAVSVTAVLAAVISAGQAGEGGPGAYVWAAALGALMFWRRAYPRLVLALTVFGLFAYYAIGYPAIGVAVPVAGALFSAAEAGHRRAAGVAAATVLGVSAAFRVLEGQDVRYVLVYEMAGHLALVAAAIALGELVRARRRIQELTDQQISLAAERRLDAHKQALSRELHDSIGHTLTVAAIHAGVARQEAQRDPAAAATALDQVRSSVSEALSALRTAVRQLRSNGESAPVVADVEAVAETARAAGYDVRTHVATEVSPTAYRVVREAVTNAMRHSPGRSIDIDIGRVDGRMLIRVEDGGSGLHGLRDEVTALGGEFHAGPAGQGWLVTAKLPLSHE